jgi:hypothetical protein
LHELDHAWLILEFFGFIYFHSRNRVRVRGWLWCGKNVGVPNILYGDATEKGWKS